MITCLSCDEQVEWHACAYHHEHMQTRQRRIKSAVVRVIHEHAITGSNEFAEFDCKCGKQFWFDVNVMDQYALHADHVAMMILDAFDKIKEESDVQSEST